MELEEDQYRDICFMELTEQEAEIVRQFAIDHGFYTTEEASFE